MTCPVNLTRRLSAPLPPGTDPFALAASLGALLTARHPAPHAGHLLLPGHGVAVVSPYPGRFLRRDGATVLSQLIKGTARDDGQVVAFGEKDRAENVMIVDLVRNDLARVCEPGSVTVPALLARKHQPGLVHLVSTVWGRLSSGVGWPGLLAAPFPPGSVTGAPKLAAREVSPGWSRYPGARTAAHWAGWTPTVASRTSTWRSGRSGWSPASCASAPAAASPGVPTRGGVEQTELKSRRLIAAVTRPG